MIGDWHLFICWTVSLDSAVNTDQNEFLSKSHMKSEHQNLIIFLPPLLIVRRFVLIEPTTWHHIMQKIIIYVSVYLIMEFEIPQQIWKVPFKGQLISKCIFGILNSPKKWTKKLNFTTMVPQVKLFLFFFLGELKTPKRHFEINWPSALLQLFNSIILSCISRVAYLHQM